MNREGVVVARDTDRTVGPTPELDQSLAVRHLRTVVSPPDH